MDNVIIDWDNITIKETAVYSKTSLLEEYDFLVKRYNSLFEIHIPEDISDEIRYIVMEKNREIIWEKESIANQIEDFKVKHYYLWL
jgi:hypothetical protein